MSVRPDGFLRTRRGRSTAACWGIYADPMFAPSWCATMSSVQDAAM